MDRVSKLIMAIKSPEYLEYLENISRNTPNLKSNITFFNGNACIITSIKGQKKAIVLPKYKNIQDSLETLYASRDALYNRYRYLRNKILFTEGKPSSVLTNEYDDIVRQLTNIDTDIEVLDTYKRLMTTENIHKTEDAYNTKEKLLAECDDATTSYEYLTILKRIKDIDENLQLLQEIGVEYYIDSLPKILNIRKEIIKEDEDIPVEDIKPKKRGRKPKVAKGGNLNYIDEHKLKNIVKSTMKKNFSHAFPKKN
jgi:hypothetical protein